MNYYRTHAPALFAKYQQMDSAALHRDWLHYLPKPPGHACDTGAGSGRDANMTFIIQFAYAQNGNITFTANKEIEMLTNSFSFKNADQSNVVKVVRF